MDLTKFSNLPGIDTYNADVYESSDLPEDEQAERMFKPGIRPRIQNILLFKQEVYSKKVVEFRRLVSSLIKSLSFGSILGDLTYWGIKGK